MASSSGGYVALSSVDQDEELVGNEPSPHIVIDNSSSSSVRNVSSINDEDELQQDELDEQFDRMQPDTSVVANANWLMRLTFNWLLPLLQLGAERPLQQADVWHLPSYHEPERIARHWRRLWAAERKKAGGGRVLRVLWLVAQRRIFLSGAFWLLYIAAMFSAPLFMKELFSCLEDPQSNFIQGVGWSTLILFSTAVAILSKNHAFCNVLEAGLDFRALLSTAIYSKTLRLNNLTKGEVVTLMSVDAKRIESAMFQIHSIWTVPLRLTVGLIILYHLVGAATFGAVVVVCTLLPLNWVVFHKMNKLQEDLMKLQDERVKFVSEVLQGILTVKFFAWEPFFKKKINKIRIGELNNLWTYDMLLALVMFFLIAVGRFMTIATFALYFHINHALDSAVLFSSMSVLNAVVWPLFDLPWMLSSYSEASTSLQRVTEYLTKEELVVQHRVPSKKYNRESQVVVRNCSFRWQEVKEDSLHNIDFEVKGNKLVAVIGQVGSGKSSLLSAILGEMKPSNHEGEIKVEGTVAYVSQQAWIKNATLKDNVVGFQELDESQYKQAIAAAQLESDLDLLPAGDQTEIGERGINLSGGQKQRVNIARAVYADRDIYLFDDPLSAVDAHVGKALFEQCIKKTLKHKTRILVTHQLQYLPMADDIYIFSEGRIIHHGTFQQLTEAGVDFSSLVFTKQELTGSGTHVGSSSDGLTQSGDLIKSSEVEKEQKEKDVSKGKTIEEEERFTGAVEFQYYKVYLGYYGPVAFLVLFAVASVLSETFSSGSDVWISYWSQKTDVSSKIMLTTYFLFGLGVAIFALGRQFLWFYGAWRASRDTHTNMLSCVMRAPMSFFQSTPQGRILNRFSRDQNSIDETLPDLLSDVWICCVEFIAQVIIIIYASPVCLLLCIPLALLFYKMLQFYRCTSRELRRLDAISYSPIYSQFSETIDGLSTIRAFGAQDWMKEENIEKLRANISVALLSLVSNRWFASSTELLGAVIIYMVALYPVFIKSLFGTMSFLSILSIVYASELSNGLQWFVRQATQTEAEMSRVERVVHYSRLDSEAAPIVKDHRPGKKWPSQGRIEFNGLQVRYRSGLPLVLDNVTASIAPQEKIGIVGRTGAGKSTFLMTLFRIVELSGGSIVIDGVNIAEIGLRDLRRKIAIIPQDPVLFSGTIRSNLDPTESNIPDSELWRTLGRVNLRQFVEGLPAQLDHEVKDGGQNLSVGQRQLICLGRAMLKDSKILVIDEATASVDHETDAIIQQTIRTEFGNKTVLTIAHRLATIIDYDRIMVLSEGRLVEFDSPHALLSNPESAFSGFVADTGHHSAQFLCNAARAAFNRQRPSQ